MLKEYQEAIEQLSIRTDRLHWLAPKREVFLKGHKHLVELFKKISFLDRYHNLERICNQKYCLNPLHYETVQKYEEEPDFEEVKELCKEIDLNKLEQLGFQDYLTEFNSGNPLPARKVDFFEACNRKLKWFKMEPLSGKILFEEGEN